MRLSSLLACVVGICLPFTVAQVPAHMNGLFTVDPNCANVDVDGMLTETVTLLNAGVNAANSLLNNPDFTDQTTRLYMRNMKNSFGTSYFYRSRSSYNGNDIQRIQQVQITLSNVQRLLGASGQAPRITPAKYYLACGSTAYQKTTNAQDIDSNAPQGQTIEDYDGSEFVFYVPGHRNAGGIEQIVLRPDEVSDADPADLCSGNTYGFAVLAFLPYWQQIVLCPHAFDSSSSLQSIASITSSSSPGRNDRATSNIGNYESLPATFLHELIHLLGSTYNEQYFTTRAVPTKELQCYGPQIIYILANLMSLFKPLDGQPLKGTVQAPDPFIYFCSASLWTFKKWRWLF